MIFGIYPIDLAMFGDGAASAGASAPAGSTTAAAAGSEGGKNGAPASTGQESGVKILYGKQPAAEKTAVGEAAKDGHDAGDDRNAKYKELVSGEFKDLYDADINRIIGKRFKDAKATQEQLDAQTPILSALAQKYGVQEGDIKALSDAIDNDNSMWEQQAEEAGMSVEQYRQVQKLQRENAQLKAQTENAWKQQRIEQQTRQWLSQAEELKANPAFRDFDLAKEIEASPDFLQMLKNGISVQHAYSVLHMDDMLSAAAGASAKQAASAVVSNIRARGARPAENGVSPKSGVVVKADPKSWSKEDLKNVWKATARGERIVL